MNWPADIFSYTNTKEPKHIEGPLYNLWLEWRVKVIHDFFVKARVDLKKINPDLIFGDYTGVLCSTYYEVGMNWASKKHNPTEDYQWATSNYQNYGYVETLEE